MSNHKPTKRSRIGTPCYDMPLLERVIADARMDGRLWLTEKQLMQRIQRTERMRSKELRGG